MDSFDDPNLKSALRRACGRASAPTELRRKIESLSRANVSQGKQGTIDTSEKRKSRSFGTPLWFGLALAACVLIAVGIFFMINRPTALPFDVASNMIKTHDRCSYSKNHFHIQGDFAAIGTSLSHDLKVPVLSTDMQGWKFAGAGECGVWGHPTAHLLYRQGNKTLSIFSIPSSDFALPADKQIFANNIEGHYIAAFVKGKGLYCVLESSSDGSAQPADASQMRDQLLKNFPTDSIAATPTNRVVAFSELH